MQTTVEANNIDIYVKTFGDRTHPAVLLIMGLGCQCLNCFPYFYEPIVEQGYYVIRFDNRDIGLSTWSDNNNWEKHPYSLDDLATDSVELLQALGIDKAHVIGASMGGAISQRMAISYPERVLSLTSIVSFADASALSKNNISSLSLLAKVPSLEEYLGFWSALVGTTYPLDIPLYTQLYKDSVEESTRYNPNCITHQLGAIARSPTPDLALIKVPTLIFYGTADPLIPATHAVEYAKLIANSQLIEMDGVGHDIPAGICEALTLARLRYRIHPEIFKLFKRSKSNMFNELEAVKAQFIKYSEVFNELKPELMPPFFHQGSILITTPLVATMKNAIEIQGVFTQFMNALRAKNFTRSELDVNNLQAKMLSKNIAIVSGSAIRYKKDSDTEDELERIGVAYTFCKDIPEATATTPQPNDGVWKIVSGIIHQPENAIAL